MRIKKEIVGRTEEIKILRKLLSSNNSEFLAVYGRRRVGKTFLIKQTYREESIFECTALHKGDKEQQLENFRQQLKLYFEQEISNFKSWLAAFSELSRLITCLDQQSNKKVIFLDEISWYDSAKSGFMPAFANFWNSFCSDRSDIVLVICGSAVSWIIDKILNDKGGLHNRVTRQIHLEAFTIQEVKTYLEKRRVRLALKEYVQIYFMLGGIPYYLNFIEPGQSIAQIIETLFLSRNAALKREFNNLYKALFKNASLHEEIVKLLSKKNKGLTRKEIISQSKFKSGGWLTEVLRELEECGFINISSDYTKKKEDALHRLVDEYSIFYFKFIKERNYQTGQAMATSQAYKIWSGFAFENFCMKHIKAIAKILGISGIQYRFYGFLDKGSVDSDGTQIDLIIDRADNCVNIIEARFHNTLYKMKAIEARNIAHKVDRFVQKTKTDKSIFTTLITAKGAQRNEHFLEAITNEITIDSFFE